MVKISPLDINQNLTQKKETQVTKVCVSHELEIDTVTSPAGVVEIGPNDVRSTHETRNLEGKAPELVGGGLATASDHGQ